MLRKAAQDANLSNNQGQAIEHVDKSAMDGEVGEKYELVKKVGSGAFGFVQAAKHKLHGQEVKA